MNTLVLSLSLLLAGPVTRQHPLPCRPQPVSSSVASLVPSPVLWIQVTDQQRPAFQHIYRGDLDRRSRPPVYRIRYLGVMPERLMRWQTRTSRSRINSSGVEWRHLLNPPP